MKVSNNPQELLSIAVSENFVPMVDDRSSFIGIVTRQKIMEYCMEQYFSQQQAAVSG